MTLSFSNTISYSNFGTQLQYRSLDLQQHVSFICRNLDGLCIVTDITSAILLIEEKAISQNQLKSVIDTLTSAIQKYSRILILVHVEQTEIDSFASTFQYLLAGILFFPAKISLHFWFERASILTHSYHSSKIPQIIRDFIDRSPLRETSWKVHSGSSMLRRTCSTSATT